MWGDGSARRQFTYVGDVADFLVNALAKPIIFPKTFNLGAPKDFSILEFYQIVSKQMNYPGVVSPDLTKPAGMPIKLMDVETAVALGWQPRTSIEAGVQITASWFAKHLSGGMQ